VRSPVTELLADLDRCLRGLGLRWYLFGAQAAILHGAARLTADVDATVDARGVESAVLLAALSNCRFTARSDDPLEFAERTRVLPLVRGCVPDRSSNIRAPEVAERADIEPSKLIGRWRRFRKVDVAPANSGSRQTSPNFTSLRTRQTLHRRAASAILQRSRSRRRPCSRLRCGWQVFADDSRMAGGNSQQGKRRPFGSPSVLFPVAKSMNADAHGCRELLLSQPNKAPQSGNICTRLELPLDQPTSKLCWNGAIKLFFCQLWNVSHSSRSI
jgi:hypothetical protein